MKNKEYELLRFLMQNPDKSFADIASAVTLTHNGAPAREEALPEKAADGTADKKADFDPADIDF